MTNQNRQPGTGGVASRQSPEDKNEPGPMEADVTDKADEYKGKAEAYKEKVTETAAQYGEKAQEQLEKGKDEAAARMESAADVIRQKTETGPIPAEAGVKVAEGMETAASYLREHDTSEIWNDMERYVKEHPSQAMVGAIFAGFLLGRMLR